MVDVGFSVLRYRVGNGKQLLGGGYVRGIAYPVHVRESSFIIIQPHATRLFTEYSVVIRIFGNSSISFPCNYSYKTIVMLL